MPLLKIVSNRELSPEAQESLLGAASSALAELLGKPERFIMVSFETNPGMRFAGSGDPLAYLELKSIGLPGDQTKAFSAALCQLISDQLQVPGDRIYIEFSNAPRNMWGWNSDTFER